MNILKHLIPAYRSYLSVVDIKPNTKTEIADCIPEHMVLPEEWDEYKQDPPSGIALVSYFCWLGMTIKSSKTIESDLIEWNDYVKPLSSDEEEFLSKTAVQVVEQWNEKMMEVNVEGQDLKLYLQDANVLVEQKDGSVQQMFVTVGQGEDDT